MCHYLSSPTHGQHLAPWAEEQGFPLAPSLLTTRLDNDDAIAGTFIEYVRTQAEHFTAASAMGWRDHAWNYPVGYQLSNGKHYLRIDTRGPFASLLEHVRDSPPKTVLGTEHRDLSTTYPTSQLWTRPAWAQVVHGENLMNDVAGIRIPFVDLGSRFGLQGLQRSEDGAAATATDVARSLASTAKAGARRLEGSLRGRVGDVARRP